MHFRTERRKNDRSAFFRRDFGHTNDAHTPQADRDGERPHEKNVSKITTLCTCDGNFGKKAQSTVRMQIGAKIRRLGLFESRVFQCRR